MHTLWIEGCESLFFVLICANNFQITSNYVSKIAGNNRLCLILCNMHTLWIGSCKFLLFVLIRDATSRSQVVSFPKLCKQHTLSYTLHCMHILWIGSCKSLLFVLIPADISSAKFTGSFFSVRILKIRQ